MLILCAYKKVLNLFLGLVRSKLPYDLQTTSKSELISSFFIFVTFANLDLKKGQKSAVTTDGRTDQTTIDIVAYKVA